MRTTSASTSARLARIFGVTASAALALAGCALDGSQPVEESAMATEALNNGGGRGGNGFTCSPTSCTCSKGIEGDCDRMLINCVGDLTSFDTCMNGWLTTDCTCATGLVRPPPRRVPIDRQPGGGIVLRADP